MQSPPTKRRLRTRALDDTSLLCLSYALATALLLLLFADIFEWHTLHSIMSAPSITK
jgi:hypothetical protein